MQCKSTLSTRTILVIVVLSIFSVGDSFGQFGIGDSKHPVKPPENFEHFDCGFRYPRPGTFTLSTSIGYSAYRNLGDGQINRFTSNLVTYDIGCIDLDDPPRKMKKDELISSLNAMTQAYLADSFEFISRPASNSGGREIYEFESKSFPPRRIKYLLEGNRVLIFLAGAYDVSAVGEAVVFFDSVKHFSVKEAVEKRMATAHTKISSTITGIKTYTN